jgi:hypothetical protein
MLGLMQDWPPPVSPHYLLSSTVTPELRFWNGGIMPKLPATDIAIYKRKGRASKLVDLLSDYI